MRRVLRSLVAALALDLERLIVRMVSEKLFNIRLRVLTDAVKVTFELSCKAYGYDTEDLGYGLHDLLRRLQVCKVRIVFFKRLDPDPALALEYLKLAESLEPVLEVALELYLE